MKTKPTRVAQKSGDRPLRPRPGKTPAKKAARSRTGNLTLRLYVAGQNPRSLAAFANLKRLCDTHLAGRCIIEVIDLVKQPHLAQGDQIVAIPTLVRKLPEPVRRVIGDLSDLERVMVGMDLKGGPDQDHST